MYFAGEAKVRLNRYSIEYLGYSDKEIVSQIIESYTYMEGINK